ncbi:hypothetical protein [Brachybacterium sp. UNK5269]|uniref:hypothetical protein n=1 Tax=Brachybacterium sp. UNK5269 TaxID=3408576 RepID=UPI003BAF47F1
MHNSRTDFPRTDAAHDEAPRSPPPTTEGWTPEDRAPSAAENNFMSFALFGVLVLFGIGCFILL